MAAVGLNDNLRVQTGKHLDEKYGGVGTDIYPDVATALSSVAAFERVKGLTVAVDDGSGGAIEYWYQDGVKMLI